jgi:hypothetical protein
MGNNTFNHDDDFDNYDDQYAQSELRNSPDDNSHSSQNIPYNDEESIEKYQKKETPIDDGGDEMSTDPTSVLPPNWQDRYIPTGKELRDAAEKSFNRLRNGQMNDTAQLSKSQLESHTDIIKQTSEFSILLPEVVDCALGLKNRYFGAANLDLWKGLLIYLFFKATDYTVDTATRYNMLSKIATELGALSSLQAESKSAAARFQDAIDFALNNSTQADEASLLLAQVEYFHATSLQFPIDEILNKANDLLERAKQHQNHYAQMRIYMTLSDVHNHYGNFKEGFTYGQQALILAFMTQKSQRIPFALTLIAPYVFNKPKLRAYQRKIMSFWHQAISSNSYDIRLQSLYLGQLSPYLYRHKKYESARKYYLQGVDLHESMGDKDNSARMMHGLGMTYTQLGEWDNALASFNSSLALYSELGQVTNQVWIQHCIGWLTIKRGDTDEAIGVLELAYESAQNLPLDTQRRDWLITGIKRDLDDAMNNRSQLNSAVT